MKKLLNVKFLQATTVLLIMSGMVACGEENEKIISPIIISDERLTNFFDTVLPTITESICLFSTTNDDTCYIINNIDEFRSVYSCNDLPEIDFTSYSLIIGQKRMPNSYYSVIKQYIVETRNLQLNVVVKLPENHWPSFSKLYYWGIYPKIHHKIISVNIINEK
jgi:chloramphenicol O-acetyltransferase